MQVECPHAASCAGCPAIDEPYDAQLRSKGARVDRALARFPALGVIEREPVRGAEPLERYRTRVKLVVDGTKIGLFSRRGDHVVVDIPGCRVMTTITAAAVALLRARVETSSALARALRAVDLREVHTADGPRLLVTLVLDEAKRVATEAEARRLHSLASAAGIPVATVATSTRPSRSPQLLGRGLRVVVGPESVDERVEAPGGRSVSVPAVPGGFVQAHRAQAAALRGALVDRLARDGVDPASARVVDAYAGSGALGLGLAAAGARVLLVESYAPAMELARASARDQGLTVKAVAADASEALGELARRGDRPDVVVLNPPRRGVAPEVREAVAALGPRLIAYVSCEPDTLARDLDHLARLGYATNALTPFDLIPLSREVESLVVLSPRTPEQLEVVARAEDAALVAYPAREPDLDRRAQAAASLVGEDDATLVARWGSDDGAGLALVARDPARWREAADGAEVTWHALVRGIARAKGSVNRALDGQEARTRYRRLAIVGGHSLLEVRSEPADPDVLARHLAGLGHALLGATRHGHAPSNRHFAESHTLDRAFLHVARFVLTTPEGARWEVEPALPGDLETVLARAKAESARRN